MARIFFIGRTKLKISVRSLL